MWRNKFDLSGLLLLAKKNAKLKLALSVPPGKWSFSCREVTRSAAHSFLTISS